jgi:zinc ribbon protein
MLLLFGIHTTTRVVATPERTCGQCGYSAPHHVLKSTRRFTFFFIPVFRVGRARLFDTCTVCGLDTELPEAEAQTAAVPPHPTVPQDAQVWTPQDRSLT